MNSLVNRFQTMLQSSVVGALIAAASLPAQAVVVTYTDRDAFLAALASSSTDSHSNLPTGGISSPLTRAIPDCPYTAAAVGGLYASAVDGSMALSTD